jgi:hypothetical protein
MAGMFSKLRDWIDSSVKPEVSAYFSRYPTDPEMQQRPEDPIVVEIRFAQVGVD